MSRRGRRSDASLAGTAWVAAVPSPERCRSQPQTIYRALSNSTSKPFPENTASVLLWGPGPLRPIRRPVGSLSLGRRLSRQRACGPVRVANFRRAARIVRSVRRLSAAPMDGAAAAADENQPVLQHARQFRNRALAHQQFPQTTCLRGIAEPELLGFVTAF